MQVNKIDDFTHFDAKIKICKDIKDSMSSTSTTSTISGSFVTVSSGIASEAVSESSLIHSNLLIQKFRKGANNIKALLHGFSD